MWFVGWVGVVGVWGVGCPPGATDATRGRSVGSGASFLSATPPPYEFCGRSKGCNGGVEPQYVSAPSGGEEKPMPPGAG